jgi:polysaccharide biosynthesis protein PslG
VAILVAVVLVTGAAITAAALGPTSKAGPPVRTGFNNNAVAHRVATPNQAAATIAHAGAKIDRVQMQWSSLEPRRGERHFAIYDAIYQADIEHGVKPLFIIASAPPWATDAPCAAAPDPCHAAPAPAHFRDMARTAAAIARRYPRAAGIEIWNEPNAPYFWAPTPDPYAYAKLLKRCYEAIKRANPKMRVAGGATSSGVPSQPAPGQIVAADFVAALQASRGFRHMDALSLHAYAEQGDTSGESAVANVQAVREVLRRKNRKKPIWITETGVTTSGPDGVSEEAQMLTLLRIFELLPEISRVKMVLVHTLVEPPGDPASAEKGFGVVRSGRLLSGEPQLQPKPAYCALREVWGGESGCGAPG